MGAHGYHKEFLFPVKHDVQKAHPISLPDSVSTSRSCLDSCLLCFSLCFRRPSVLLLADGLRLSLKVPEKFLQLSGTGSHDRSIAGTGHQPAFALSMALASADAAGAGVGRHDSNAQGRGTGTWAHHLTCRRIKSCDTASRRRAQSLRHDAPVVLHRRADRGVSGELCEATNRFQIGL